MNLLKQPLVQFLLLGALIFGLEKALVADESDPRKILIDDARYAEIAGIYRDNQGRDPSEKEMADLVVTWAQNEVLYREASLMGLDKGDEMIRQRLILKLRNVLFNRLVAEAPSEQQLRDWFEQHRDRYDRPDTFDFEQFKIGEDASAEQTARTLANELDTHDPGAQWLDQIRRYQRRPASNIALVFGDSDAASLIDATDGRWHAVRSPAGWHLARVTARHAGKKADFDVIRSRVGEDWKSQAMQAELSVALHDIAQRYDVRIELSAPPENWDAARIEEERLAMRSAQ